MPSDRLQPLILQGCFKSIPGEYELHVRALHFLPHCLVANFALWLRHQLSAVTDRMSIRMHFEKATQGEERLNLRFGFAKLN